MTQLPISLVPNTEPADRELVEKWQPIMSQVESYLFRGFASLGELSSCLGVWDYVPDNRMALSLTLCFSDRKNINIRNSKTTGTDSEIFSLHASTMRSGIIWKIISRQTMWRKREKKIMKFTKIQWSNNNEKNICQLWTNRLKTWLDIHVVELKQHTMGLSGSGPHHLLAKK